VPPTPLKTGNRRKKTRIAQFQLGQIRVSSFLFLTRGFMISYFPASVSSFYFLPAMDFLTNFCDPLPLDLNGDAQQKKKNLAT
jgi:hypothetical protein